MVTITKDLFNADLIVALNANFTELATIWGVNAVSMLPVTATSDLVFLINHNFRTEVVKIGMSGTEFIYALNAAFSANTLCRRFQDRIINNLAAWGEPSALVSDDGNRLDLWINSGYYFTTDGINWSPQQIMTWDGWENIYSPQISKHGDTYYAMCSPSFLSLELFSSIDRYTWTHEATIFELGGSGNWVKTNFGNPFMWKEGSSYFLLYEAKVGGIWRIGLATADNVAGPWTDSPSNPVITYDPVAMSEGNGNPELAMINNQVYKKDGRYYMYYHYNGVSLDPGINRAYSYDLINWVDEGIILDSRIPFIQKPWTNVDHCLCEFKGRTYLFYTNNANGGGTNCYTCVGIDNRPLSTMLDLLP